MTRRPEVIVAGHICLDVIPQFADSPGGGGIVWKPGKLIRVGPSMQVTGGAVANTGLALHKLGIETKLMGKVGTDLYGQRILAILREHSPALIESMVVDARESTSYTIVISPPGLDRMFLHCPGANDSFGVDDISWQHLAGARVLHFGYPPLMRRIYQDKGEQLVQIFRQAKQLGLICSLDMAAVDPQSEAGKMDWPAWLQRVLPSVDVFLPSLEEIRFMLDRQPSQGSRDQHSQLQFADEVDFCVLSGLSSRLLGMGVAVVVIKLGEQGLYIRTASDPDRLQSLAGAAVEGLNSWQGRELWSPCYEADFRGSTGAGDCTIAGFLCSLLSGGTSTDALNAAAAVGACSVEAADAVGGIAHWNMIRRRMAAGWKKRQPDGSIPGWQLDREAQVWLGPGDRSDPGSVGGTWTPPL